MSPRIESGQLCTVEPVEPTELEVGDIVLCKVNRSQYLHLVKAIQGARHQIGNEDPERANLSIWHAPAGTLAPCVLEEFLDVPRVRLRILVRAPSRSHSAVTRQMDKFALPRSYPRRHQRLDRSELDLWSPDLRRRMR